MKIKNILFVIVVLPTLAFAELKLPNLFSDGMVLQQSRDIKIWGWADAHANVEIQASWMEHGQTVRADKDGKWFVLVNTPKASSRPREMTVRAKSDTIKIKDILIGEVWLASGQSNMNFPLFATENAKEVVPSADYPQIRFFRAPKKTTDQLQTNTQGKWEICRPKAASGFSGVAYYFAKTLHEKLDMPIGIIQSAVGGTPIEAWMDRETLTQKVPTMIASYDNFAQRWINGGGEMYSKRLLEYEKKIKEAKQNGTEKPEKPKLPFGPEHNQHPCGLYNGMIYPFVNYRIKGFVWYQGEANAWRAKEYMNLFPAMVQNWRNLWQDELPFYFVQIAPCTYYDKHSAGMKNICAELREAQRLSLDKIPNSGMVVSLDMVTDFDDIHPKNKKDIGLRLAKFALNKTYKQNIICSGPLYKKMEVEDNKVRLYFSNAQNGLVIRPEKENGFEIAGEDEQYYPADIEIEGDTLLLNSADVPKPSAVRYGWSNTVRPTLFNGKGLPASTFRTDNSQWETEGKSMYF